MGVIHSEARLEKGICIQKKHWKHLLKIPIEILRNSGERTVRKPLGKKQADVLR